jgi:prefoldin subunit 5
MVGGALLEKTVSETIPVLNSKLENINAAIEQLQGELKRLATEFEMWKKEKNIKIIKQ